MSDSLSSILATPRDSLPPADVLNSFACDVLKVARLTGTDC